MTAAKTSGAARGVPGHGAGATILRVDLARGEAHVPEEAHQLLRQGRRVQANVHEAFGDRRHALIVSRGRGAPTSLVRVIPRGGTIGAMATTQPGVAAFPPPPC